MRRSILTVAGAMMLSAGLAMPLSASAQPMGYEAPVYGSELMTERERSEYRERLSNARSDEERERIRSEHHERMEERARERGVTLPDRPPREGAGMGQGGMSGSGYDGRQRMEEQRMEHHERMQEQMEERERMRDPDDGDYRRGSGMGGGGGRN